MKRLAQSLLKMKRKEKSIDLQEEVSGRSTFTSHCQAATVCPKGKGANVCLFLCICLILSYSQCHIHSIFLCFPRIKVFAELTNVLVLFGIFLNTYLSMVVSTNCAMVLNKFPLNMYCVSVFLFFLHVIWKFPCLVLLD